MATSGKPRLSQFFTRLLYSFLHALLLIILCWSWLSLDYTLEIEKSLAEKSTFLKRILIGDTTNYFKDLIFLDVSGTKKLIKRQNRQGVEVITDRLKLADFLNLINKVSGNDYQYIIYDLLSDRASPDDPKLRQAINQTARIITAYKLDNNGINATVFTDAASGYVGYNASSGFLTTKSLIKYNLISGESLESLPAVLYEKLHRKKIQKFAGLALINGRLSVNSLFVDLRIRNFNLNDGKGNTKVYDFDGLLELLKLDGNVFFEKFLKGKIIIIGDFESDVHETVFGTMPGSLILYNVFLSLKYGDTMITFKLLVFITVSFVLISLMLLYPPKWLEQFHEWCEIVPVGLFLGELFLYTFLIWLVSFLCYLFFNFQLNIVSLSLYLSLFATTKYYIQEHKKRQSKQ